MYKAGRFYELTPKALEFVNAVKKWAKKRGIPEEDIPYLLEMLSQRQEHKQTLDEALDSLIEKGFFSIKSDIKRVYEAYCTSPYELDRDCEYRSGERCLLIGECNWKSIVPTESDIRRKMGEL